MFLLAEVVSTRGDERCGVSPFLRYLYKIKNKSGNNSIMSMSTVQKVTVVSCVCVCVALLLPKLLLSGGGGGGGRRDPASAEGKSSHLYIYNKI